MFLPKESVVFAALCAFSFFWGSTSRAEDPPWRSIIADVDVRKDAQAGEWRKLRDVLEVSSMDRARITLPAAPEGEYDYRVSLTRHLGSDSIVLIFPVGDKQACFEVDAEGENLAGFEKIDGKSIRDNPTKATDVKLRNGQRYTMMVQVRKGEIRGLVDGKVIASHKTDGSDLSLAEHWALPLKDRLGLGTMKGATTIYSIEYRGAVKSATPPPTQGVREASPAKEGPATSGR